jgi:DNA polymerase-3 subunit epsilon
LKFRSFTQGSKAVQFINAIEEFDIEVFKKKIEFKKEMNFGWERKKIGEKCF